MKKSLLVVALAFVGSAVFAQQAPADLGQNGEKPALNGKKIDVKAGVSSDAKTADSSSSLWVPIGDANKSGKKNLKLDVKAVKQ
jgi:hypothetical protein